MPLQPASEAAAVAHERTQDGVAAAADDVVADMMMGGDGVGNRERFLELTGCRQAQSGL
jgi:hypothetical protein